MRVLRGAYIGLYTLLGGIGWKGGLPKEPVMRPLCGSAAAPNFFLSLLPSKVNIPDRSRQFAAFDLN